MNGMMEARAVATQEMPARTLWLYLDKLSDVIGDILTTAEHMAQDIGGPDGIGPKYDGRPVNCMLDQAEEILARAQLAREKLYESYAAIFGGKAP